MIKKILLAAFLIENFILASTFGFNRFYKRPASVPAPTSSQAADPSLSVPAPAPAPIDPASPPKILSAADAGIPAKIYIPRMSITADVEQVELAPDGRMDVTKDVFNVGWYKLGPSPGQLGSSVMTGHFDTPTGAPSVFYNLYKLKAGDELTVEDDRGIKRRFVVEKSVIYPDDGFPVEEVFNTNDAARLNLITCMGTFNKATKTYSHRLVVYTKLKD